MRPWAEEAQAEGYTAGEWLDLSDCVASDAVTEHPESIDVRCGAAATGTFSVGGLEAGAYTRPLLSST